MFRVDIERKLISKTSLMDHMTRVKLQNTKINITQHNKLRVGYWSEQ